MMNLDIRIQLLIAIYILSCMVLNAQEIKVSDGHTTVEVNNGYDGSSASYGIKNNITGNSTSFVFGVSQTLSGTGHGAHHGLFNRFLGAAQGTQYGVLNEILVSGDGDHYGFYNKVLGAGSGMHVGTYNTLYGSGSGIHYGTYNSLTSTGKGLHVGGFFHAPGANNYAAKFNAGHVVFNDVGESYNFQVKSQNHAHQLFLDGSSGRIGIGTSTPAQEMEIQGDLQSSSVIIDGPANQSAITFDNGLSGLHNSVDVFQINRPNFHLLLDRDNNNSTANSPHTFKIFKDVSSSSGQTPELLFSFRDDTDSYIQNIGHLGIKNDEPEATLDVAGKVKIADDEDAAVAGMIRYNEITKDFEGYDGEQWRSLTKKQKFWGVSDKYFETSKATTGEAYDRFGSSIDIQGDIVIIGANGADKNGLLNRGTAYIFKYDGTTLNQIQELSFISGGSGDKIGSSVAIDGNYAIAGAPNDNIGGNTGQGSAYIFHYNGTSWAYQAKLTGSAGGSGDSFGSSVDISGDYVIIGAPHDDVGSYTSQGSAYIFRRIGTSWIQETYLISTNSNDNENFGSSVAIEGNWAVIGAPGKNQGSYYNKGAAYVYQKNGTIFNLYNIYIGANQDRAHYGQAVALTEQFMAIGSPGYENNSNRDEGQVNILAFNGSDWINTGNISASNGIQNLHFGTDIDIKGDNLIVGIDPSLLSEGRHSAYLFRLTNGSWIEKEIFYPSDIDQHDSFGTEVCIGENCLLIAIKNDDVGTNSGQGSVYVYPKN